jgi:hypothetical protein
MQDTSTKRPASCLLPASCWLWLTFTGLNGITSQWKELHHCIVCSFDYLFMNIICLCV